MLYILCTLLSLILKQRVSDLIKISKSMLSSNKLLLHKIIYQMKIKRSKKPQHIRPSQYRITARQHKIDEHKFLIRRTRFGYIVQIDMSLQMLNGFRFPYLHSI